MKKIQITINQDLYEQLEAMKLYWGYRRMSEVVIKAIENLVNQHTDNEIYKYYLQKARTGRNEVE